MSWELFGLIAFIGLVIFTVGAGLLHIMHRFDREQSNNYAAFVLNDVVPEIKKQYTEAWYELIDIVPEKMAQFAAAAEPIIQTQNTTEKKEEMDESFCYKE